MYKTSDSVLLVSNLLTLQANLSARLSCPVLQVVFEFLLHYLLASHVFEFTIPVTCNCSHRISTAVLMAALFSYPLLNRFFFSFHASHPSVLLFTRVQASFLFLSGPWYLLLIVHPSFYLTCYIFPSLGCRT